MGALDQYLSLKINTLGFKLDALNLNDYLHSIGLTTGDYA